MSLFHFLLSVWIIVGFSARDLLQKASAPVYKSNEEAGATYAIYMALGILFSLPFLHHLWLPFSFQFSFDFLENANTKQVFFYPAILIGVIKGYVVFSFNSKARSLDLTSVSGATYLGFFSVAIGSSFNFLLFGIDTNWISIIFLSLISVFFYTLGPGKQIIHARKHGDLYKAILFLAFLIVIDQVGIKASNWYIHLTISNSISFLLFLSLLFRKKHIKDIHFMINKYVNIAGILYVVMEFSFVYSFSVLGVNLAFLFGMLSYLPTMIYGSLKHKEGRWFIQVFFGLFAVLLIYIMAFL